MSENRWQDIFLHLKNNGFEVYPPGTKIGECKSPYIVVKNNGQVKMASLSTGKDLYSVMVYVPKNKYSILESKVEEVKKSLNRLKPMVVFDGTQTPSFYDDAVKAHMISLQYRNYKKL